MTQEKSIWDIRYHGDLQARMPMNWDKIDMDVYNFYKNLISEKM